MNKVCPLTLNSDTFREFKDDFDEVVGRTLITMAEKKADVGEVTAKFRIELMHDAIGVGEDERSREAVRPQFKHKISSVVQIKDELSGELCADQYELVYDEVLGYVMKAIPGAQCSLFDDYDEGGY